MFKNCLLLFFAFTVSGSIYAQSNLLNSKKVDEIGKKNEQQLALD
jgi:hypothetical protein